jgi:hypothetical protein
LIAEEVRSTVTGLSDQLVLSDGLSSRHVLGHLQMMPQVRQRLFRPLLQLRIGTALGVPLKQGHGILVAVDLLLVVSGAEVGSLQGF